MNPTAFPDDLLDLCRQLIRQAVGSHAEISRVRVLNHHQEYWVLRVQMHHPHIQLVLKLAGHQSLLASDFDRTAALHRLIAAQTSLTVAEILAADTSCQVYPWRYLLKTFIDGQEWRDVRPKLDPSQQRLAYAQIGSAVAQIHSVRFSGFGELSDAAIPAGNADFLSAFRERARRSIRQSYLLELFLNLIEVHAALFADIHEACLCHEDLHHRNLLFRDVGGKSELATVLDFEKAWSGYYEIDLSRLEFWDGMVGDGFWDAYLATHSLDSAYVQRRLIYQLLWCFEYAASTPRHLQDTQRLCQQLGIPVMTSF